MHAREVFIYIPIIKIMLVFIYVLNEISQSSFACLDPPFVIWLWSSMEDDSGLMCFLYPPTFLPLLHYPHRIYTCRFSSMVNIYVQHY